MPFKLNFMLLLLVTGEVFGDEDKTQAEPFAQQTVEDMQNSADDDNAQWELGIGLGYLNLPHYRGSDQRADYVAPFPYVRYRGKRLNVDREGGRYYFWDREAWKLDLSAAFAFPVDSEENRARTGMPDLDPILEVGPRLQWYIHASDDERFRVRLGLPVRLAINLSELEDTGWVFSPYLQFRYFSSMETAVSIGPIWATEKYHDYYYQVDNQFATPSRPAYDAQGGYSGFRLTFTNSHRISKHWWWVAFARYDTLSGAAFIDSPLVKQDYSLSGGVAFSYIFKPVQAYYDDQIN